MNRGASQCAPKQNKEETTMERKIGQIFQHNKKWYQCVEGDGCKQCAFYDEEYSCCDTLSPDYYCCDRSDGKDVIFKELEKVGEPLKIHNRLVLRVKADAYKCMNCCFYSKGKCELTMQECEHYDCGEENKFIEIKQTKEDMEEEKHSNSENIGKNLKLFDLQAAKVGKPVCTRDGRKVRIICFDSKNDPQRPIVALVEHNDNELLYEYTIEGKERFSHISTTGTSDLMMLPEKKEGWVNVYKHFAYRTKEEAQSNINPDNEFIDTIKIEWEE